MGLLSALMGLSSLFTAPANVLPMVTLATSLGLAGLLVLPSAGLALLRLSNRPIPSLPIRWDQLHPNLLILAYPLVLLGGVLVEKIPSLAWLFMPVIQILAVGLPVFWFAYLARRGLEGGSLQRQWGVFDSGLVLGPALILIAEVTALVVLVVAAAMVITSDPELARQFNRLAQQMMLNRLSPEETIQALRPYLTNPYVVLAVLAFAAVFVPLIEELFKPVGVWLLAGRRLTPAAGFAAGALSGAGYALFENLPMSGTGTDWAILMLGRVAPAMLHITTTAVSGWALVQAWEYRRYVQLGLTYLLVVLVHGMWNALTLLTAYATLLDGQGLEVQMPLVITLGKAAPIVLALVAAGLFTLLLAANRALRQKAPAAQS